MTTAPISLQDLRQRLYDKAKTEKDWRLWGLYVHVVKLETLRAAYKVAKQNNGAPGIDGVTFEAIEAAGVEPFLVTLRDELVARTYRPLRNRRVEIPKDGGKVRVLGIPALRDRVVQGALKLILEPIFEADFCDGSYGYRPQRSAHEAVNRVAQAIVRNKTRVIDVDLVAFFDTVRHDVLLGKVARRVQGRRNPAFGEADATSLRETRGAPRRGDLAVAGERLPHGGGCDAGAGQGGDPERQVHVPRVRALCRRPGDPGGRLPAS
jgi:RNA-directed DNA polymerase